MEYVVKSATVKANEVLELLKRHYIMVTGEKISQGVS
jgi:hypothetical protein